MEENDLEILANPCIYIDPAADAVQLVLVSIYSFMGAWTGLVLLQRYRPAWQDLRLAHPLEPALLVDLFDETKRPIKEGLHRLQREISIR